MVLKMIDILHADDSERYNRANLLCKTTKDVLGKIDISHKYTNSSLDAFVFQDSQERSVVVVRSNNFTNENINCDKLVCKTLSSMVEKINKTLLLYSVYLDKPLW